MNLFIKYQVCQQCKMLVKEDQRSGLHRVTINVAGVEIQQQVTKTQYRRLKKNLLKVDLELLDKKDILIRKIMDAIIEIIGNPDKLSKLNHSDYLSEKLNYNYSYLSNLFSEVKGITIQQFIIINKIERVKELLLNEGMSLEKIADKLHYSSIAHLSNQFKKITGFSTSYYRQLKKRI